MLTASQPFLTANAVHRKEPIFLLTIDGYYRAFSNKFGYGTDDFIISIDDLATTVNDLDGGADLGTLVVTVQDRGGAITADFPGFVFEGKKVTLSTGFKGMATADFLTVFTGVIDTVASVNSNQDYAFSCTDNLMWTSQVIFGTADDGAATDQNHPRTLNGHPLDLLISIVKNELNRTDLDLNETHILGYRDSIFAGLQFTFEITSPPAAQDFIEQQLMQPLGGYLFTNAQGQLDVHFSGPNIGPAAQTGSMVGAFVDSSGQIIGAPFLVGYGCTLVVPVGANHLQLGLADNFYSDNAGSWFVDIIDETTGTTLASSAGVPGHSGPWEFTGGINSAFPYSNTGAFPPTSQAVTAGHTITVKYVGGTASILGFSQLAGPLGPGGWPAPDASNAAFYVYTPQPVVGTFVLDQDNTIGPPDNDIPTAGQADLVNQVSFRFDADSGGGSYKSEAVKDYAPSIALYTQYGQRIIQSDGMRSGLQGYILAAQTSALIFQRYGSKNLKFDGSFVVDWGACVLEVGDVVAVTNPFIPDRKAGARGITLKLFEVLDRSLSFNDGRVTLSLLDTGLNLYKTYYIAPTGEVAYASASAVDQGHYMFMCNDSDKYSTGAAANTLS